MWEFSEGDTNYRCIMKLSATKDLENLLHPSTTLYIFALFTNKHVFAYKFSKISTFVNLET